MKSLAKNCVSRRGLAICFGLVFVLSAVPALAEGVLWGYLSGARAAKERQDAKAIADQQTAARQVIDKSTELLQNAYKEYHDSVLGAQAAVEKAKRDVEGALPEEMKDAAAAVFAPPPSPAAEEAKPKMPLPSAVKKYEYLREDLVKCQKADDQFKKRVDELLAKAQKAKDLTAQDKETADALAQLANDLSGAYTSLLNEKWLRDARTRAKGIERKASRYAKDALARIKIAVGKRKLEEAKKAAAEKAAAEKAAEEEARKELVGEEQAKAQEEFDALAEDLKDVGNWNSCMRKLTRIKERMKTKEGQAAAEVQLKKIEFMDGLLKFLAENAKGFRFKDRRGNVVAIVTKSDDSSFTIQKQKYVKGKWSPDKSTTVSWDDFYALNDKEKKYADLKGQFLGYMNQFIMGLVINGRDEKKIGAREQSEFMLGAALTLKYLHSDKPGVDRFIPKLVKAAVDGGKDEKGFEDVKGFGRNRKWAVKWFPDVELSEAEDIEE